VVRAGTHAVLRSQATLDRINVFPVADADTGANLVATLTAAAAGLGRHAPMGIDEASRLVADAALRGARGNSGAIFAQFLDGLASGLGGKRAVNTMEFASAAISGADAAYLAVYQPREGTILTVLRAWAGEMASKAPTLVDFRELAHHALEAARVALADTPQQLEVLRRHHVVDAGGQGLVCFLEGWEGTWEGLQVPDATVADVHDERQYAFRVYRRLEDREHLPLLAFRAHVLSQDVRGVTASVGTDAQASATEEVAEARGPHYCAQALVRGERLSREAVGAAVAHMGESLVMAGGAGRMSVHLHTDDPAAFLAAVETLGSVESFNVDDMWEQTAAAPPVIALVTDSTCDMSEAVQSRFNPVMIPLTIRLGDREYLDRAELPLDEFYRQVRATGALPRSSQPNRVEMARAYRALLDQYESVVSIHLSSRLSGTYQTALAAAEDVDPARVRVVDSRHVSVGTGAVVEAAGDAIRAGRDLEQVVAAAEAAAIDTRVYGATPSLTFAVKGGRVSSRSAALLDLFRVRPVILFDGHDGSVHIDGAHLGFARAVDGLAKRVEAFADGHPVRLTVSHAESPAAGERLLDALRRRFPAEEISLLQSGAVLATHTGLGAVAVAVRRLPSVREAWRD